MIGKYSLRISNKNVCYSFEVKRKITIIRGFGATGKSYMAYLSNEHLKVSSITCDVKLVPMTTVLGNWEDSLRTMHNKIFIADEDFPYLRSKEFAEALLSSDNYFILITRNPLKCLPYSICEIYTLVSEYKADKTVTTTLNRYQDNIDVTGIDLIITEDTNSGYQFYNSCGICDCVASTGKSDVKNKLLKYAREYSNICIIVDGAAFGADVDELLEYSKLCSCNVFILAPESFEFLLLNAGVFNVDDRYLTETYNYHDLSSLRSIVYTDRLSEIQSWEDFYTELLSCLARGKGKDIEYTKSQLKPFYLKYKDMVLRQLKLS